MKRIIMMLALTALLVVGLSLSALSAFAASPSQRDCETNGGTFDRDGGKVSCTTVDEGKPHPNDKFESIEEEESNGTLQNRPHHEESQVCTDTGSGKCPKGQFR